MNIADEYEYMDEELQDILWGYAEEYLDKGDDQDS
jgi:predicted protein tyrosine phosphatase